MAGAVNERIILAHKTGGVQDFIIELFLDYWIEEGDWVGVCKKLGVSTCAETLERAKVELRDFAQLQLNGVESLFNIKDYLSENDVEVMVLGNQSDAESGFVLAGPGAGH